MELEFSSPHPRLEVEGGWSKSKALSFNIFTSIWQFLVGWRLSGAFGL